MKKDKNINISASAEDDSTNSAVRTMKDRIIKILKEAGIYSPTQSYQAELAAGDLLIYRKLRAESMKAEPFLVEISREGNERHIINPIFDAVSKASLRVTADFEKLTMNVKDSKIKNQSKTGLDVLNEQMSSLLND